MQQHTHTQRYLLILLVACLGSTSPSQGAGTVISLHKSTFFEGGDPLWVIPDSRNGSATAKPGCSNLPNNFTFESARFFWNQTDGVARCHFIWFFYEPNCGGGARGVQVTPKPLNASETWVLQDPILSRATYAKVMEGKSLGCSFDPDPCVQFPCADSNAQCNSSLGWSWQDDAGKPWAQQTRNCSLCKEGFFLSEGKCVPPSEACKQLNCKAPSVCQTSPTLGPACICPAGYQKNNKTLECDYVAQEAWLVSLNDVRTEAVGGGGKSSGVGKSATASAQALQWAPNLADIAQNWTNFINSTNCGKEPKVLAKMGSTDYSQSDVWVSWSTVEASAVKLWAPQPSDADNPRTARITDAASQYVGCGKSQCGPGAFFTCLFWPKTI